MEKVKRSCQGTAVVMSESELRIPLFWHGLCPAEYNSGMAEKKRIRIDDYNATIGDFPFKKYAEVIFDDDGNKGTVIDAEWVGNDPGGTHYTVTYWVKSLADGAIIELKLPEIRALNRNQRG
jgi:hypothetical protein